MLLKNPFFPYPRAFPRIIPLLKKLVSLNIQPLRGNEHFSTEVDQKLQLVVQNLQYFPQ
ncbi:MAG: hypothetical protein ACOX37_09095 [Bacillota bacterium]|jgi:hypothetical protein